MMVFLMMAALMLGVALLFVLPPLVRKGSVAHAQRGAVNLMVLRDQLHELDRDLAAGAIDPAAHQIARQELEKRVVEETQPDAPAALVAPANYAMAWFIGLSVLTIAAVLYCLLGSPAGLDPARVSAPANPERALTQTQIEGMVDKLAKRLKDTPTDAAGWGMLARSYAVLGRFSQAADAYAQVAKLTPGNAQLFADYAEALAMSHNKTLHGEPEKLLARALEMDPKNIKALALSGAAAAERRDYAGAVVQWKKILALLPADSDMARSMMSSIDEAQKQAQASPNVGK